MPSRPASAATRVRGRAISRTVARVRGSGGEASASFSATASTSSASRAAAPGASATRSVKSRPPDDQTSPSAGEESRSSAAGNPSAGPAAPTRNPRPTREQKLFVDALKLPLQPHEGDGYYSSEKIGGSKHFGYELLHPVRTEPWGQTVARVQSIEGAIVGVSYAPSLHD
jgi:hypothetical protein